MREEKKDAKQEREQEEEGKRQRERKMEMEHADYRHDCFLRVTSTTLIHLSSQMNLQTKLHLMKHSPLNDVSS